MFFKLGWFIQFIIHFNSCGFLFSPICFHFLFFPLQPWAYLSVMRPLSMSYSFDSSGKVSHHLLCFLICWTLCFIPGYSRFGSWLKYTHPLFFHPCDTLLCFTGCCQTDTCTWGRNGSTQCNLILGCMNILVFIQFCKVLMGCKIKTASEQKIYI